MSRTIVRAAVLDKEPIIFENSAALLYSMA